MNRELFVNAKLFCTSAVRQTLPSLTDRSDIDWFLVTVDVSWELQAVQKRPATVRAAERRRGHDVNWAQVTRRPSNVKTERNEENIMKASGSDQPGYSQ